MSLDAFFAAAGPFLRGETDVDTFRELGPSGSTDAELSFYPWLVANDQRRILQQTFPRVHTWCDRIGVNWGELVARYVDAHPPGGFTVASMGEYFSDWLEKQGEVFPVGFASVADVTWTRFLARTAVDHDDLGWDRRLFIRTYPVDPVAYERALDEDQELPEPTPCTLVIYRDERSQRARSLAVSLPMIAALLVASDMPLEGHLKFPEPMLSAAKKSLLKHGVLSNEFE